jgi:CcmD family protein
MEHFGYLFAAYSVIFAAIFLYALFIWRRQASLEAELRALERRLEALSKAQPEQDSSVSHSPGRLD